MIIIFTLNGKKIGELDSLEGINEFPDDIVKDLYEMEQRRIILDYLKEHCIPFKEANHE